MCPEPALPVFPAFPYANSKIRAGDSGGESLVCVSQKLPWERSEVKGIKAISVT